MRLACTLQLDHSVAHHQTQRARARSAVTTRASAPCSRREQPEVKPRDRSLARRGASRAHATAGSGSYTRLDAARASTGHRNDARRHRVQHASISRVAPHGLPAEAARSSVGDFTVCFPRVPGLVCGRNGEGVHAAGCRGGGSAPSASRRSESACTPQVSVGRGDGAPQKSVAACSVVHLGSFVAGWVGGWVIVGISEMSSRVGRQLGAIGLRLREEVREVVRSISCRPEWSLACHACLPRRRGRSGRRCHQDD